MIEMNNDQLIFAFPEVHPDARLVIEFQRTLRIPDGGRNMPRLPSLGRFSLYSIDEFADRVPEHWLRQGGGMLPMYQSEAMWLSFQPSYSVAHQTFYPFAVKIATDGTDAVTGQRPTRGMSRWPQDYLVVHDQSWLGGYQAAQGGVRQFVAMSLGSGYQPIDTPQRQIAAEGHVEIAVYPMAAGAFEQHYPRDAWQDRLDQVSVGMAAHLSRKTGTSLADDGLIRQRLEEGLFPLEDWNTEYRGSYCLQLANSLHWCAITGGPPPSAPPRIHLEREQAELSVVSEATQAARREHLRNRK